MSRSIEVPALDDAPSYLETGLWEGDLPWHEVVEAHALHPRLDISGDVLRVPHPRTGVILEFRQSDDLAELLRSVGAGETSSDSLPPTLRERLVALGVLTCPAATSRRQRAWNDELSQARRSFARSGYATFPMLLSPPHLARLRLRYRRLIAGAQLELGDSQCSTRWKAHDEPAARSVHGLLTPVVSQVVGVRVKPSYSYLGSYESGSVLREHVDREQCEFSITMLVDYLPEPEWTSPWPIYLRVGEKRVDVRQRIGDSLLYEGRRLPHSRDALPDGHTSTSVFFHFVHEDFQGSLE